MWDYKDATWTLAAFLRTGDIYYEFAQKLLKAADNPPARAQEAGQDGLQGQPRRLWLGRDPVQGRHPPVRHPGRGRGEEAMEGHPGARRADGRDQRIREESAREPVEVPSRRVPISSRTSESDWRSREPRWAFAPLRTFGAPWIVGRWRLRDRPASRRRSTHRKPAPPSRGRLGTQEAPPATAGGRSPRRRPRPPSSPTAAGKYDAAVAQAKAALNKNERYTPAMLMMAKAYYKLGKTEWTRKLWEMMQANGASDAEKSEIYQMLAFLEVQQKNVPGAIELSRRRPTRGPTTPSSGTTWARSTSPRRTTRTRCPCWKRRLSFSPASPRRILNLGSAYRGAQGIRAGAGGLSACAPGLSELRRCRLQPGNPLPRC